MLAQQTSRRESLPPLTNLFRTEQLVRCVVTGIRNGDDAEPKSQVK